MSKVHRNNTVAELQTNFRDRLAKGGLTPVLDAAFNWVWEDGDWSECKLSDGKINERFKEFRREYNQIVDLVVEGAGEIRSRVKGTGEDKRQDPGDSFETPAKTLVVGDERFAAAHVAPRSTGGQGSRRKNDEGRNLWIGSDRSKVIAKVFAMMAERHAAVIAFRKRYLRNRLVPADGSDEWMRSAAKRDGKPRPVAKIALPPQCKWRTTATGKVVPTTFLRPEEFIEIPERIELEILLSPERGVERFALVPGGRLDALRVVGENLAKEFPWRLVSAMRFVLTGKPPNPVSIGHHVVSRSKYSVCTRVVLDFDPMNADNETITYLKTVRKILVGGQRKRRQEAKHLALATLAIQKVGSFELPKGKSAARFWEQMRKSWNSTHPDDRFETPRLFKKDCRTSVRRLLDPLR